MHLRIAFGATLLSPFCAWAQPAFVQETQVTRGVTLPPTSAATVSDATALTVNPAALSSAGGLQLLYAHERAVSRNQVIDSLFVGGSAFNLFGYGASVEWIRGGSQPDYRKTALGLSLGSPVLSLGAAWNHFASADSFRLDRLSSWDIGLSIRPIRPLSVGFTIRNLDEPHLGTFAIPRTYDTAVGVRPFGERYQLAIDWIQEENKSLSDGRLAYTLNAELLRGIWLTAGISHGWAAGAPFQFQAGATVNLEHFGLTYALGGASEGLDHVALVRLSTDVYRGISIVEGKVAVLDLPALLSGPSSPTLLLLGHRPTDPFVRLMRLLDQAERDPDLKGLILKVDNLEDFGLAKAEELKNAVLRIRRAGKRVLSVMLAGGDAEYLVAAAAERVYAVPQATLAINGFSADVTFLGEAMDKLGVHWDVARVGAYKNAPDQLTREGFAPEHKEALNALLQAQVAAYELAVSELRNLSPQKLRAVQAEGLLAPKRAQALGLIDEVVTPAQLEQRVRDRLPNLAISDGYRPEEERSTRWGLRRRVAIVPVIGTIVGGKSRESPLGIAESAGAETIIRALDEATSDPRVEAIVLRVDSGGGDGLASDLIYRAVLEAKAKKPVIASMGDAAASGGYYVAMGADEVFASASTVTGSIGVFVLKPALQGLGEKLGIHQESLQTSPAANFFSLWRPWTEEQRRSAQRWADAFYEDFITEVSARRKLPKEDVDGVARGRVWSGTDAKSRQLVDQFGGLWDAVEQARKQAHIPQNEDVEWAVYGRAAGLLPGLADGSVELPLPSLPAAADPTRLLAKELGVSPEVLLEAGPKAMPPFSLRIR